jgi:predicted Zn-dependent protease
MGRAEDGVAVFEEGLALAPHAAVLRIGLAYLHLSRNERTAAQALFAQVHAAAPQRHDAMIGLADVMSRNGDYAAAADFLRRALALRGGDAATRIRLAKCLLEMGERQAGEAAMRAALRDDPQLGWDAVQALSGATHGRAFLRPSTAVRFLGGESA